MKRKAARSGVLAVAALCLVGGLTACDRDPLAEQYRAGDNKGYIAADGVQWQEIPEASRGEAVAFSGALDNGSSVSSADYAGQVTVVNFWYATCGPCILEAPLLEQVYQEGLDDDVAFLGVNTYDQPSTALSFARDHGVSYPSAMAVDDAELKLAFIDSAPLSATPTTLVLDRQGRVAARFIGGLPDATILQSMVQVVVDES